MKKEMLINVSQAEECRIALLEDGTLEELYTERTSQNNWVGTSGKLVTILRKFLAARTLDSTTKSPPIPRKPPLDPEGQANAAGNFEAAVRGSSRPSKRYSNVAMR